MNGERKMHGAGKSTFVERVLREASDDLWGRGPF